MAISVLDVREGFVPPPLRLVPRPVRGVPAGVPVAPAAAARRRAPAAVVAGGALAVVEAVALMAGGLTGLAGTPASPLRPAGLVMALVALAGWIVLCAGSGAALIDAAGNRLYRVLSCVELVLVSALLIMTRTTAAFDGLNLPVPLPALALLAVAVPTGKLLLAGAPSAVAWVAQGPRAPERHPDPVARHRILCGATLGVIAVALGAVAVLGPTSPAPHTSVAGVVTDH